MEKIVKCSLNYCVQPMNCIGKVYPLCWKALLLSTASTLKCLLHYLSLAFLFPDLPKKPIPAFSMFFCLKNAYQTLPKIFFPVHNKNAISKRNASVSVFSVSSENAISHHNLQLLFIIYFLFMIMANFNLIDAASISFSKKQMINRDTLPVNTLFQPFNDKNGATLKSKIHLSKYDYVGPKNSKQTISFTDWFNKTQQISGIFLNHNSYSEGEVLLFRRKNSRHRAIPVMNVASFSFRFSDALTFKEWLKIVYLQQKVTRKTRYLALKVSVRTTEVVRPVLQHLYASKGGFKAPIIIHANTFLNNGRSVGSYRHIEKPVDLVVFIRTVTELLPEAAISLGWTQSFDYSALNQLDWSQTFCLMSYIYDVRQPVIINMRLNDAMHSIEQLKWLLGAEINPQIYIVLHGKITDFVDSDLPLQKLATLSEASAQKILFDVDEKWRQHLNTIVPKNLGFRQKEKRSIELETWKNIVFNNPHKMLSTSIVSSNGVAFLGWPNSIFVSTRQPTEYLSKQRISGRVMFLFKQQSKDLSENKNSGMIIQMFEKPINLLDSSTLPNIKQSIKVFIGYDGRVSIENDDVKPKSWVFNKKRKLFTDYYSYYYKSSMGKLPKCQSYEFQIIDRGWRVELDIWSVNCTKNTHKSKKDDNYRMYLQLNTPITRSRKTRNVAISKSGDGTIDFIFCKILHNKSVSSIYLPLSLIIRIIAITPYFYFVYFI